VHIDGWRDNLGHVPEIASKATPSTNHFNCLFRLFTMHALSTCLICLYRVFGHWTNVMDKNYHGVAKEAHIFSIFFIFNMLLYFVTGFLFIAIVSG
jgi:hypothetical protein